MNAKAYQWVVLALVSASIVTCILLGLGYGLDLKILVLFGYSCMVLLLCIMMGCLLVDIVRTLCHTSIQVDDHNNSDVEAANATLNGTNAINAGNVTANDNRHLVVPADRQQYGANAASATM